MGYRCRGFTLLELMIVMVMVGVLLGMVSLASGGSPVRQVRQEAEAMVQVTHQLRERAVFEGQEYGLRLSADGYRVMRLGVRGWEPVKELTDWPLSVRVRLQQDGYTVDLDADEGPPQLLMLSNDETSAFTLTFESGNRTLLSLSGDGIGEVVIDG
ncbi:type II secretion system minor pseudopilin GspH [Pseudomonas fluorescens]|uniref:type II secretion system minor pseudopilin GspH n=1 Tax=Pseudomonas fluorescens TaxID=294 RepID=UPI0009C0D077|nr:type II secretion system minor pseudopilin GspH [Pseudomonas fluorescens]